MQGRPLWVSVCLAKANENVSLSVFPTERAPTRDALAVDMWFPA